MKLKHYKGITYKALTREEKERARKKMVKILELNQKLLQERIKTVD